jgi:hypothetical protein
VRETRRAGESELYNDTMEICLSGHKITEAISDPYSSRATFCPQCGAKTINACTNCGEEIEGALYSSEGGDEPTRLGGADIPKYCRACGNSYPWQEDALKEFTAMVAECEISDREKEDLSTAIEYVTHDTVKTPRAAEKINRFLKMVGEPTGKVAREILTKVATELALKQMGFK